MGNSNRPNTWSDEEEDLFHKYLAATVTLFYNQIKLYCNNYALTSFVLSIALVYNNSGNSLCRCQQLWLWLSNTIFYFYLEIKVTPLINFVHPRASVFHITLIVEYLDKCTKTKIIICLINGDIFLLKFLFIQQKSIIPMFVMVINVSLKSNMNQRCSFSTN